MRDMVMVPDDAPDTVVRLAPGVEGDACRCACHSPPLRGRVRHFAPCCRRCGGCGERIRHPRVAAHAGRCPGPAHADG